MLTAPVSCAITHELDLLAAAGDGGGAMVVTGNGI